MRSGTRSGSELMGLALPGASASATRADVAASQRQRLLGAAVLCVSERGYAATTVAHVVDRAGVSKTTFYQHFRSKPECVVAALRTGFTELRVQMRAAAERETHWLDRLDASTAALLAALCDVPDFARAFFVEVPAAGADAEELRRDVRDLFVAAVSGMSFAAAEQEPGVEPLPPELVQPVVGGIAELIALHIRNGQTTELPALRPVISRFVVAVLLGSPAADRLLAVHPR